MSGIVCTTRVYKYKNWLFEIHNYCGPWPLKKDYELRKRAGKQFFKMYSEFNKLSNEEKSKYLIQPGGCISF